MNVCQILMPLYHAIQRLLWVVEVGMPASPASTARDFLTDIIKKANSVSGGNGLGVFYWEPEAYNNGYGLGAFDSTGKPAEALDAFGN